MLKHNIGDVITIRKDLNKNHASDRLGVVPDMIKFRGKSFVIEEIVCGRSYHLKGIAFGWTDSMFEDRIVNLFETEE